MIRKYVFYCTRGRIYEFLADEVIVKNENYWFFIDGLKSGYLYMYVVINVMVIDNEPIW